MSSVSAKPTTTTFATDDWRPFPFRRVLPIAQLLLCTLLLWPYRAYIAFELFGFTPRNTSRLAENAPSLELTLNGDGKLDLPADPQFRKRISAHDFAFDSVSALNLPGGMVQLPYDILSADHREWMPASVPTFAFKSWRAVTWPLLALPFWWMAGRGAEALSAAWRKLLLPRIRWFETLLSFGMMAGGVTAAIGLGFFAGADPVDPQLRLFVAAFVMWALLGSLTVVAKLAQWRINKKIPAPSLPAL
jgi:hypothetical protein